MATMTETEIAYKVIDRMRREGIGTIKILSVLAEIYPETSEDELTIFLADYINKSTDNKKRKSTKIKVPRSRPTQSDPCAGSSQDRGC
jgi:hypothetical protein